MFLGLSWTTWLFIALLVLKLLRKITISWWWVTAPLWIPFLFVVAIAALAALTGAA